MKLSERGYNAFHSEYSPNDPPTYAVIGDRDGIALSIVVKNRIKKLRAFGIDADISVFRNVGHGFGLGVGTSADGWIDGAAQF